MLHYSIFTSLKQDNIHCEQELSVVLDTYVSMRVLRPFLYVHGICVMNIYTTIYLGNAGC